LAVVADRVENRIAEFTPADLVVVNPPRAGLSRQVTQKLVSQSAEMLAYVSCDPATLARDLARLQPAWRVEEVQPFDAFPQTAHVETVAWLNRC
jgi:23S rRNA (uracil1939-C5)-methyltransferase